MCENEVVLIIPDQRHRSSESIRSRNESDGEGRSGKEDTGLDGQSTDKDQNCRCVLCIQTHSFESNVGEGKADSTLEYEAELTPF